MSGNTQQNLQISKNYFKRPVLNLKWVGIAINDIKHPIFKQLYSIYAYLILFTFTYFYTVAEIIDVFENLNDMDRLFFTMSFLIAHINGCAKITVLLLRKKSIQNFLKSLEEGRFLPNLERGGLQEVKLIQEAVAKTAWQRNTWWAIIFIMLSNRLIWIILNPTIDIISPEDENVTITIRQFPYTSSYLIHFDMLESPSYELVLAHQVISVWIFGWYLGNADNIVNGLMIHLAAQFKIVTNSFNTITQRASLISKYNMEKLQSEKKLKILHANRVTEIKQVAKYEGLLLKNFRKDLKECIKHHQGVLDLCQNMEDTFNLMLLLQFLGSLSLYCFQLYQLSMVFQVKIFLSIESLMNKIRSNNIKFIKKMK